MVHYVSSWAQATGSHTEAAPAFPTPWHLSSDGHGAACHSPRQLGPRAAVAAVGFSRPGARGTLSSKTVRSPLRVHSKCILGNAHAYSSGELLCYL